MASGTRASNSCWAMAPPGFTPKPICTSRPRRASSIGRMSTGRCRWAIRAACPGRANRSRRRDLHQAIPDLLWHGDLDATLAALTALRPTGSGAEAVPRLEQTIRYLEGQCAWVRDYAAWQEAGKPIGSGLVERAVCVVINRRMKRQGMRWRRVNAE